MGEVERLLAEGGVDQFLTPANGGPDYPAKDVTPGLVPWLREQIAEDRKWATAASPGPWSSNAEGDEVMAEDGITVADGFALSNNQLRATVDHIAAWDPVRVLAECDAKLAILELHPDNAEGHCRTCWPDAWPCSTLLTLARPYAGRPGYREEWKP